MSAASKRRWRANPANAAAERERDLQRRTKRGGERSTTDGRLAESIRDTIRHIDRKPKA